MALEFIRNLNEYKGFPCGVMCVTKVVDVNAAVPEHLC